MATVAAAASSPTGGYDRAFWISAAAIAESAAVLALALPGKPKPQQHATSDEQISVPALVDA